MTSRSHGRPDPRAGRAHVCSGSGFTLLEVMVALALLAAAMMAVADLCGNALRNHMYARDLAEVTLLARGKMAELEQKYEDEGFKDFDQSEEGDFSEAKRPDVLWRVDLIRPAGDLSADQLVSMITGMGGDAQGMIAKLMGGGAASAASSSSSGGPSQPSMAGGGLAMGAATKLIQSQVTAFGETLKKSFREMRLTVAWRDGKTPHGFTVTTHLVVLNPRAPGGVRGDNPEVPANLANALTAGAAGGVAGAAGAMPVVPAAPGTSTGDDDVGGRRRRVRGVVQ
jgi:prepilin-type N-terminal cleavage/methylation domain-containing protein